MKIVCLTESSPGQRYTANVLHRAHGVALVVFERSKRKLLVADLKRFGAKETFYRVRLVGRRLIPTGRQTTVMDRHFAEDWRTLDPAIPHLVTRDINSVEVVEAIRRIQPDVIVCQGTTLVREATIAGVPHALNVHHGLSPWYRGSRCTEWAIATGDVHNIGVTVHRLTPDIDGGPILGQARVEVAPDDTVAAINSKIFVAGTAIVSDAIARLKRGEALRFLPQPPGEGTMFWRRQFSRFLGMHVEELLRRQDLPRMLRSPSAAPKRLVAPWPPAEQPREAVRLGGSD